MKSGFPQNERVQTTKLRELALSLVVALTVCATLALSFALPRASAEEPSLLYATADTASTPELVAANLEAESVSVIGGIGFPFSLALAFCARKECHTR